MIYIRSAIFLVLQALSTVVVSLMTIISIPLPSLTRGRVVAIWSRFNLWVLRKVCGNSYQVKGTEHIPDQPSVILSNHQSTWETLALQTIFPPISFVFKKELLWIPFFGWGLAANRPIAINRSRKVNALEQLLRQGRILLEEGRWLALFPEGSRTPPGRIVKYQVGGAYVAVSCGVKVVPVAHNAGYFWEKKSFLRYPGVVDMVIGEPIETAGRTARDVNSEAEAWIREAMSTLPIPERFSKDNGSDQAIL